MRERLLAPRPAVFAAAAAVYAGGIFALSHLPGSTFGAHGPLLDFAFNYVHAPLFGGLSLLVSLALARRGAAVALPPRRLALAVFLVLAYGVVDELHQSLVSGRSPSALDLVTDCAGAVAAAVLVKGALDGGRPGPILLRILLALGVGAVSAFLASRSITLVDFP